MGVRFDEWQRGLGSLVLGKRADGKYASTVGGVTMSIPRQVGKTFLIGNIVIALCLLHEDTLALWTAQRVPTSTLTFEAMQGMVRRKKVKPFLAPTRSDGIRTANGEQQISFRNGSTIMFGSRDNGFGRGFTKVDVEVFDEAQMLKPKVMSDMVPAMNQPSLPGGALIFFMGTPPRPLDLGDEFRNRRKKALSGTWHKGIYVEMSADPHADLDDWNQLAKANPSFPQHTDRDAVERMRENITDDDDYRREAFGIWDDDGAKMAFRRDDWVSCVGHRPDGLELAGLGVAVSSDLDAAAIVAAGVDEDRVHVRVLHHAPGTAWLSGRLLELQGKFDVPVAVDPKSPATSLVPVLERDGVDLRLMKSDDVFGACGTIDRLVREHLLRHEAHDVLDRAVEQGRRRESVGRWAWKRPSGVDITALEAATWAVWAATCSEPAAVSAYESRGVMTI